MCGINPNDVMAVRFKDIRQMNPFYDPAKANNGGGYDQPEISFTLFGWNTELGEIRLRDTSCGDFGTRYDIIVADLNGSEEGIAAWGTIAPFRFPAPEEWTGIMYAITQLVNNHVGTPWFNIPVQSN